MSRLLFFAFLPAFFFVPEVLGFGIYLPRSSLTANLPIPGSTNLPSFIDPLSKTVGNFSSTVVNKTKSGFGELKNVTVGAVNVTSNKISNLTDTAVNATKEGVEGLKNLTKNADDEFREMYDKFVNMTANMTEEALNNAVDCLGLGKTVAKTLEYVFQAQANGPDALDVKFTLSSSKKPGRVIVTSGNQFGLEWTDFDITRLTVIIVHGFLSSGNESWVRDMEHAFQKWVSFC